MTQSSQLPSHGMVTVHVSCHVTYHCVAKLSTFWNPWPQFVNSLCHFRALRRGKK